MLVVDEGAEDFGLAPDETTEIRLAEVATRAVELRLRRKLDQGPLPRAAEWVTVDKHNRRHARSAQHISPISRANRDDESHQGDCAANRCALNCCILQGL